MSEIFVRLGKKGGDIMYRRVEVIMPYDLLKKIGGKLPTMHFTANAMVKSGLPDPSKKCKFYLKRRGRFFFTEKGWKQCGHHVLSEIRSQGLYARIITIKEKDPRANVIYQDKLQALIAFGGRPR